MTSQFQTEIDLHTHSTESDGTLSPDALVSLALQQGLAVIALTDHDTASGLMAARTAAKAQGIELVNGIELSTDYQGTEVHMLGYFIDETNPVFAKRLEHFRQGREERNRKMARKLQEEGFSVSYEKLKELYPGTVITRAHFARYLVEEGLVKDRNTVFGKYLGNGCRCYVPREKISPFDAIELIHTGGGLAYFAHPILCRMPSQRLDALVKNLKEHGLTGLEAVYSTYLPAEERQIKRLAEKYDLLCSGGSDFHGANKPDIQLGRGRGNLHVPYLYFEQMKEQKRYRSHLRCSQERQNFK